MILMKYTEILKKNRELGLQLTDDVYKIGIISNITITQLKEVLEFGLRAQGINAVVEIGNYDAIVQDSFRYAECKAVLIFWESANFIDGLENIACSLASAELDALAERVEGEIDLMLHNLKTTSIVLINKFSTQIFCADVLKRGPLTILCDRLNVILENKVASNQIIVDQDRVLGKVGLRASVDFRQFQTAKALYSIEFFKAYVEAVKPAFLAATGRSKKVLVLDCDNTLWGGILGEDGLEGIKMCSATPKGKAFREVQLILKGFQKDGILLALCSKNNPLDVDKVLDEHQDAVLKNEHFVAKRVNWHDKATNLREIAAELNLGLDSFVFVDDSDFEIGLVKRELPQVMCVQVPQNLSEYAPIIREIRQDFFSLARTAEDGLKTEMYRQEKQRKEHAKRFDSLDDYLVSLDLKMNVLWDGNVPVPRFAQLTQKTNQFNLTTKRYTETDIQRLLSDQSYLLAAFSVVDKHGDYGITGLVIVQKYLVEKVARIDTLLMSCRIIGRNMEYVFFDYLISRLIELGVVTLRAEFIATPKNEQVSRFYDKMGFTVVKEESGRREYICELGKYNHSKINYIKILESEN